MWKIISYEIYETYKVMANATDNKRSHLIVIPLAEHFQYFRNIIEMRNKK